MCERIIQITTAPPERGTVRQNQQLTKQDGTKKPQRRTFEQMARM